MQPMSRVRAYAREAATDYFTAASRVLAGNAVGAADA
jgi:hypothetical protein